jgi:hypothetical protein
LFFVCMDDEARFRREKAETPVEHRNDLEAGRSLAFAFTGIRRPERMLLHFSSANDADELGSRLLGATWGLTAREMNDPDYFFECLGALPPAEQALMRLLPERCREARGAASSYDEWRSSTKDAVVRAYAAFEEARRR